MARGDLYEYEEVECMEIAEAWPATEEEQTALLKSFRLTDWEWKDVLVLKAHQPYKRTRINLEMPFGTRSFDVWEARTVWIVKPVTYETIAINCTLEIKGTAIEARFELLSGRHISTVVYDKMDEIHLQLSELREDAYEVAEAQGLMDSSGQRVELLLQGQIKKLRDETLLVWAGGTLSQENLENRLLDLHAHA
eukprot:s1203_g5.t1